MDIIVFQIILGIVQGVAEFLPISSSGHLALVNALGAANGITIPETTLFMEVALHLATVLAVILIFWRDLWRMITSPFRPATGEGGYFTRLWKDENGHLLILTILATIPAVIIGLLFKNQLEAFFDSPSYVAIFLICTGIILLVGHLLSNGNKTIREMGVIIALAVGCAQAVAILPGISRSGSTIVMAMLLGMGGREAARFSLIISVPAVLGAAALKAKDALTEGFSFSPGLVLGFLVALIVGYLAIHLLLRISANRRFIWFSAYCMLAGTCFLIWTLNAL